MGYFTSPENDIDEAVQLVCTEFLARLAKEAYDVATTKGWEAPWIGRTFGDECALLHSEISEALEAYRERGMDSWEGPDGKPEGVGSEFADIFIRLLHYCYVHGIDLQKEYDRKTAYNRTRGHRHGGKRL